MKRKEITIKGEYSHLDLQTVSIRIDDIQFKPELYGPDDLKDLRMSLENAIEDINYMLERVV
jgi:hypothetical protein